MLGIDPDGVRVITPDVGGAFGAKFGADPEHAVVCWVARQLGRPARWTETRNENLVGMTHGRAQRQKIKIGGSRDGTVAGLPDGDHAGLRRLPADRRVPAVADHPDGARAYEIPEPRRWPGRWSPTPPRSAPTAAPDGRRPRRPSSGRSTCSPPRSAWTRPRCGGVTSSLPDKFTEPQTTPSGPCTTAAEYAEPRWTRRWPRRATPSCAGSRPSGGRASDDGRSSASALSCYVEITGAGRRGGPPERERQGRGHPDGSATILTGTLAARPGAQHRVGDARQRRARHPDRQDHASTGATPT